jgi:hypothetical protein
MNNDDSYQAREGVIFAAHQAYKHVAECLTDPSVMYRPSLSIDGNKWCALYGENLQDGVTGFGDSPAAAMQDFNKNWHAKLPVQSDKREG